MPPVPAMRAAGIPLYQPDQGLITNVPITMIPDRGCAECDNVEFWDGRIVVRPGFQVSTTLNPLVVSPTAAITHLNTTVTQAGTTYLQRVEAQGTVATVYSFDTSTGLWTDITGGTPVFTPANGQRPSSTQFKGEWLVALGGSGLQRWLGTGTLIDVAGVQANAALKAPDDPYFVCSTATRVFVGNAIDNATGLRVPWRVWYTDTLNSGVYSNGGGIPEQGSSGYQDLLHDSSDITGMIFHGGTRVVVFKRRSIYRSSFVGSPVWYDFLPISKSRGLVGSQALQEWNDILIWLGDDYNIYMMGMDNNIQAVGDAILPILRDLVNPYFAWAITGVVDRTRNLYKLTIPYDQQGATVNEIFTLNLKTGAWSRGHLASSAFQMSSAFWYRPDPPFFQSYPISIFGSTEGQIYTADYNAPTMIDRDVKFKASWWGKAQDLLALQQGRGETGEFHKASLAGMTGVAAPQIRMGKTLKDLSQEAFLYRFNGMDLDDPSGTSYVADQRVDPLRFGQFGVHWPLGTGTPAQVEGFTAWGLPRGVAR